MLAAAGQADAPGSNRRARPLRRLCGSLAQTSPHRPKGPRRRRDCNRREAVIRFSASTWPPLVQAIGLQRPRPNVALIVGRLRRAARPVRLRWPFDGPWVRIARRCGAPARSGARGRGDVCPCGRRRREGARDASVTDRPFGAACVRSSRVAICQMDVSYRVEHFRSGELHRLHPAEDPPGWAGPSARAASSGMA